MTELYSSARMIERFASAREGSLGIASETLPVIRASDFTLEDRQEMFGIAKAAWEEIFNRDFLIDIFSETSFTTTEEERLYVKSIRNYGVTLRGAYKFCDARHEPPIVYSDLIRAMGRFNDFYHTSEHGLYRSSLLKVLSNDPVSLDFEPASDESFQITFNGFLNDIQQRSSQQKLIAPEFHNLRKGLRHVMNVFQLAIVLKQDLNNSIIFNYMNSLSKDLGDVHDRLISKSQNGEIEYGITEVEIDPILYEKLITLTQAFKF